MAGNNRPRRYQADSAEVHLIRVSDETMTLTYNTVVQPEPAGPTTSPFWFKVSRGATEIGGRPRKIGLCYETTAPTGLEINTTYEVAVLDQAFYNSVQIGDLIGYQGTDGRVVGKTDENIYPGI